MSSRNREGGKRGKIGPKRARPGSRRRSGPAPSPTSLAAARWPAVHRRVLAAPGIFVRVGRRPRVHQTRPRAARLTRRAVSRETQDKSSYGYHTYPVQDICTGFRGWADAKGPPLASPSGTARVLMRDPGAPQRPRRARRVRLDVPRRWSRAGSASARGKCVVAPRNVRRQLSPRVLRDPV